MLSEKLLKALNEQVNFEFYSSYTYLAMEREHSTISLLKWFIDEQVEEENNFNALLKKVRRVGDNQAALYLLDDELQKRQYVSSETV